MDAEDLALTEEAMNLLQTELEAEPSSGAAGGVVQMAGPDIPALREQLAVLVSRGKAKETIGVQLTHEQVKRLSDKDVEKYIKRYETYVGSKTTDSLIDSFILLATKAVGMAVDIKDVTAYQKELRNDYIINNELSNLAGNLTLKCGRLLAVANAALITAKHIHFDGLLDKNAEAILEEIPAEATLEEIPQHSSTTNSAAFFNN